MSTKDHSSSHTTRPSYRATSIADDAEPHYTADVLHKLRPFDIESSDAQITQAVMELRAHEEVLREEYEKLFLALKHWINTGLSFEFERAHDVSVLCLAQEAD